MFHEDPDYCVSTQLKVDPTKNVLLPRLFCCIFEDLFFTNVIAFIVANEIDFFLAKQSGAAASSAPLSVRNGNAPLCGVPPSEALIL